MKKILLILCLSITFTSAQSQKIFDDPELLIDALYEEVTFSPGESPDWELAKSMFLDEAVIVLRYGPKNMTVFNVQGWVDDFVTFIEENKVDSTGFEETILGKHSFIYGDIASINVLFESHIPGTDSKNKGVDVINLIKKEDRWLIVSIINERPSFGGAIPDVYQSTR